LGGHVGLADDFLRNVDFGFAGRQLLADLATGVVGGLGRFELDAHGPHLGHEGVVGGARRGGAGGCNCKPDRSGAEWLVGFALDDVSFGPMPCRILTNFLVTSRRL